MTYAKKYTFNVVECKYAFLGGVIYRSQDSREHVRFIVSFREDGKRCGLKECPAFDTLEQAKDHVKWLSEQHYELYLRLYVIGGEDA